MSAKCTTLRSNHAVRALACDLALDLAVLDDAAPLEVDQEQLARLEAAEALDLLSGGMSSRPASEPSTTWPSVVSTQRPGRRPLRSSVAPITRPSVNATAAGPSQGSMKQEWKA